MKVNPVKLGIDLKVYKGFSHVCNLYNFTILKRGFSINTYNYIDLGFRIILKKRVKNANKSN